MNEEETRSAIARTQEGDIPALAIDVARRSLVAHHVAAGMLSDPQPLTPDAIDNARQVLDHGGELALTPLMEARTARAADRAWAIDMVVDTDNELRRATVRWLEPLLADENPLEAPPPPNPDDNAPPKKTPEEKAKAKRVCDAAYLALLGMLRFTNSEVDPKMDEKKFLSLMPKHRNAFIGGIKQTWTYRRARGPEDR